jgi:hypothetical protein
MASKNRGKHNVQEPHYLAGQLEILLGKDLSRHKIQLISAPWVHPLPGTLFTNLHQLIVRFPDEFIEVKDNSLGSS